MSFDIGALCLGSGVTQRDPGGTHTPYTPPSPTQGERRGRGGKAGRRGGKGARRGQGAQMGALGESKNPFRPNHYHYRIAQTCQVLARPLGMLVET